MQIGELTETNCDPCKFKKITGTCDECRRCPVYEKLFKLGEKLTQISGGKREDDDDIRVYDPVPIPTQPPKPKAASTLKKQPKTNRKRSASTGNIPAYMARGKKHDADTSSQ